MKVTCKLCGSADVRFETDKLRRGAGSIYHCSSCDYSFLVKAEKRDEGDYYSNSYWVNNGPSLEQKSSYEKIFNSYVNAQRNRLKVLEGRLSEDMSLLEVGCSTGHFLYNVKDKVADVTGIDFDEGALKFCCEKNNCSVFAGGLKQAKESLAGKKFDIICCFQVFEHVEDLDEFLQDLKSLLADGGTLYLEVPNLFDPLLKVYKTQNYQSFYYHEDHLHYFSEASLKKVANRNGLSGESVFYQDYNVLNHLNWMLHDEPQPDCDIGLSKPRLNLNDLGEGTVALEKVFEDFSSQYEEVLKKHGYTDNLALICKVAA